MQTEKRKHISGERSAEARPHVIGAILLIGLGLFFMLWNMGILSPGDIGAFFGSLGGSIGTFFGNLGGSIGTFFGDLGGSLGRFFGDLGRSLANLWPLIPITIGVILLLRRSPAPREPHFDDEAQP